jgi:hypothetical protein
LIPENISKAIANTVIPEEVAIFRLADISPAKKIVNYEPATTMHRFE